MVHTTAGFVLEIMRRAAHECLALGLSDRGHDQRHIVCRCGCAGESVSGGENLLDDLRRLHSCTLQIRGSSASAGVDLRLDVQSRCEMK
jgi:hypothetical protein